MKNKYSFFERKSLRTVLIVLASMSFAFFIGIETAGDIQPVVGSTKAGSTVLEGDFNSNGILDPGDAKVALEIAQGFRSPTPGELAADPDKDYHITVEDALTILDQLERIGNR